jgi:hypothetical protein
MDIVAAARALNQKAVQQDWHHFCDPTLAFVDPDYDQLLTLWREKSKSGVMPARSSFTPRDLKDILRHMLIFERVSQNPSRYRFRLVGTSLTGILGENTGKPFEDCIPSQHLPRWMECCDLILDGGQPLRFLGRVHINGREFLDAENLFVPLANDNGEPTFIMGQCRYTPRSSDVGDSWENQIASLPGGLF